MMLHEVLKTVRDIVIGLVAMALMAFFNMSKEEAKPSAPAPPVQINVIGDAADQEVYAVVYSATWCGPCKSYKASILQEMPAVGWIVCQDRLKPEASKAHIRFCNAEKGDIYLNRIESFPTTVIYSRGKEVDRITGLTTPKNLADRINVQIQKGMN